MIVAGLLASLSISSPALLPFQKPPPAACQMWCTFTGRATDKKVWVSLGAALGANFPQIVHLPRKSGGISCERSALILLDELLFYLVHAASQGSKEEGTRRHAREHRHDHIVRCVRDYKECRRSVIIIADLQKDWEQGADELRASCGRTKLSGNCRASTTKCPRALKRLPRG